MNKKQLASIERNKVKRQAERDAAAAEKKAKDEWKAQLNDRPLSDRARELLAKEIDDPALDNAIERYRASRGAYVPRVLTIKLYQEGRISTGLAMFGLDCTSAYNDMSRFSSYWHRDLAGKAASYLRSI